MYKSAAICTFMVIVTVIHPAEQIGSQQRCDCYMFGTKQNSKEELLCDMSSGKCQCLEHFSGKNCDQCKNGFYGLWTCKSCSCSIDGAKNEECENIKGRCKCKTGYYGSNCYLHEDSFYNQDVTTAKQRGNCGECYNIVQRNLEQIASKIKSVEKIINSREQKELKDLEGKINDTLFLILHDSNITAPLFSKLLEIETNIEDLLENKYFQNYPDLENELKLLQNLTDKLILVENQSQNILNSQNRKEKKLLQELENFFQSDNRTDLVNLQNRNFSESDVQNKWTSIWFQLERAKELVNAIDSERMDHSYMNNYQDKLDEINNTMKTFNFSWNSNLLDELHELDDRQGYLDNMIRFWEMVFDVEAVSKPIEQLLLEMSELDKIVAEIDELLQNIIALDDLEEYQTDLKSQEEAAMKQLQDDVESLNKYLENCTEEIKLWLQTIDDLVQILQTIGNIDLSKAEKEIEQMESYRKYYNEKMEEYFELEDEVERLRKVAKELEKLEENYCRTVTLT